MTTNQKLPEVLTEKELQLILKGSKNPKHRLAFALGFYEALRISEVACLLPEHIQPAQKILMIKGSDIAKGKKGAKRGKDRNIPIAPEVLKGLKHLPVGSLTAKDNGIRALQIAFKKALSKTLGRDDLSFHSLRHSGATFYLNIKKVGIRQLQQLLGHSRLDTTQIYTHVNPDDLKQVFNELWD